MDVLILICLLMIIVLLAKDKVVINKVIKDQNIPKLNNPKDIMGKSKYVERLTVPKEATESQQTLLANKDLNFDTGTKGEVIKQTIPEENSTEIFEKEQVDFEEEEEEFKNLGVPTEHRGYAKGVTFQELYSVGQLLQQEGLEPALKKRARVVVQALQGTELFYLLENSMEGASAKIANLLSKNLPDEPAPQDSGNSDDFDIGKFL